MSELAGLPAVQRMACLACRTVLNLATTSEGQEWRHGAAVNNDHEIVAVPYETLAEPHIFCDICTEPTLVADVWTLPARNFTLPLPIIGGTVHTSSGDWAVCNTCANPLKQRDWATLEERVVGKYGAASRPWVHALHERLRLNVTGPIRKGD